VPSAREQHLTGPSSGPVIYAAAGMTGSLPLIINAVWLVWANMSSAFWSSQVDRIGRKPLFVWNSILTALSFAIIIGLYAEYVDNAATASNLRAGQCALIFSFFVRCHGTAREFLADSPAALRVLLRDGRANYLPLHWRDFPHPHPRQGCCLWPLLAQRHRHVGHHVVPRRHCCWPYVLWLFGWYLC
jgi:hypothetical protein